MTRQLSNPVPAAKFLEKTGQNQKQMLEYTDRKWVQPFMKREMCSVTETKCKVFSHLLNCPKHRTSPKKLSNVTCQSDNIQMMQVDMFSWLCELATSGYKGKRRDSVSLCLSTKTRHVTQAQGRFWCPPAPTILPPMWRRGNTLRASGTPLVSNVSHCGVLTGSLLMLPSPHHVLVIAWSKGP